jgi:Ser/Thr protein kinase RdoA (MazF antagonist)
VPPQGRRVADELLRRFGLGPPLHLEIAPGGLLNQNLFAATGRGAYFLKGYRYADPEPVRREHAVIGTAIAGGVPALAPLVDPAGNTFLRVGGRWWAIFPRVSGHQPAPGELSVAHASGMGCVLGAIHVALAALPAADVAHFPLKLHWESAVAYAEMAGYEAMIARRRTQGLKALDPFDQHTLASFGYRRSLLAGGVPPAESFAGLPQQVLHGDFHDRNLFFAPDGSVQHVIDWELAGRGPRAWELIRALDLSLSLVEDVEAGGPLLRAFVHGYAAVAPLTAEECEAMPDLYWAARVHSLWVYEEHYRKGSAKTDRVAMQDLRTLQWLASNRARVATLLRAALSAAPTPRLAPGSSPSPSS